MEKFPLLGPLFCFSLREHARALMKAVLLWILVTSPMLLAILLSQRIGAAGPDIVGEVTGTAGQVFSQFFANDGIYVYTVSFTAPFLYLGFGRIVEAVRTQQGLEVMRSIFFGYWFYFLLCLMLLVVTAIAFTAELVASDAYKNTLLHYLSDGRAFVFYLVSIYFWYLAIIDELPPESGFTDRVKGAEDAAAAAFQRRISGK